jgi:2-oxoisovalerate ferredoxin oxidoreductase delta subunit
MRQELHLTLYKLSRGRELEVILMREPLKYTGLKDIPEAPICYGSTELHNTGSWRTLKPEVNLEKCNKCYLCWKYCPDISIIINRDTGYPEVDYYHCKGCGICANECRANAIEMVLESWD